MISTQSSISPVFTKFQASPGDIPAGGLTMLNDPNEYLNECREAVMKADTEEKWEAALWWLLDAQLAEALAGRP
jgi:hypothetical protein